MYTIKLDELCKTLILAKSIAKSMEKETISMGKIIYLHGDLGSGKTTLVRYFLQNFGITDNIRSPSFSIMEQYHIDELHFYHFDFYRFNHQSEVLNIGLDELENRNTIILIEWPEKASEFLPKPDLEIFLSYSYVDTEIERYVTLSTQNSKEEKWLKNIIGMYKNMLNHI